MEAVSQEALRPVYRLRQLAAEIRSSLDTENFVVIGLASKLLAPSLAQCRALAAAGSLPPEGLETMRETAALLNECDALLAQALQRTDNELRSLRRGRRSALTARRPDLRPASGRLNTAT